MTPLLSLILLVLIAYLGAIFFQKIKTTSIFLKSIINTGILYLLLGYAIGPNLLKILDVNILDDLSILLAFVLGWTGFLIGLQANFKQMKRFQINYYWRAIGSFSIIFILLAGGIFFINYFYNNYLAISEIVILATAGSISSPLFMGVIKKEFKLRGKIIHFLQFHSAYDNMLGVIIIGLIMIAPLQTLAGLTLQMLVNMLITIILVILLAVLFYFIVKNISSVPQYFLIILGFVLFLVGISRHLTQSALFITFIFGAVLANLPLHTWKLFQTIANAEKPIYLLLLVFVGASLSQVVFPVIMVALLFSLWRILSKMISGKTMIAGFDSTQTVSGTIGLAGIGMGGLSLALGIDYYLANGTVGGGFILSIIAISYLINDTVSLSIFRPVIQTDTMKKSN